MQELEANLSPAGLEALHLCRALRCLPETNGTVQAERSAIKNLRVSDIKNIALILMAEDEVSRG